MSRSLFINNIDTYTGQAFLREILKDGEEFDAETSGILATYLDPAKDQIIEKPKGVKKILKRYKPRLMRKFLLETEVWIYDLNNCDLRDLDYALECLNWAMKQETGLETEKTLIVFSNVMTWTRTPRKIKPLVKKYVDYEEDDIIQNLPQIEEEQIPQELLDHGKVEGEEMLPHMIKDRLRVIKKWFFEKLRKKRNDNGDPVDDLPDAEAYDRPIEPATEQSHLEGDQPNVDLDASIEKRPPSPPPPPEYLPFKEDDFKIRESHPRYASIKEVEDKILSYNGKLDNLKTYVVCHGILYGQGETTFQSLFKHAWLQEPEHLPYLNEGNNQIPTIHVSDLIKFVLKVAYSPPEIPYMLAIDNSSQRTQRNIVEAISHGVGSKLVMSVPGSELFDEPTTEIMTTHLEMVPSSLLVNEENPPDFEWGFEKGIPGNVEKILQEFCKSHDLKPMQILLMGPPGMDLNYYGQMLMEHYRIPMIHEAEVIQQASQLEEELGQDVLEELPNISVGSGRPEGPLTETSKVYYRTIKWRLNQNDCKNRGFVLDRLPFNHTDAQYIFYKQGNKLKRIRPKKKKGKKQEEAEKPPEEGEKIPVEGGEEELPKDGSQILEKEPGEGEDEQAVKPDEEKQEPEPEPEEEEPQEEEQPPEEEEGEGPKTETFFPDSLIYLKNTDQKHFKDDFKIIEFFEERKLESYILDVKAKTDFEIFEAMRIYIERNRRPYNYLEDDAGLRMKHENFYNNIIASREEKAKEKETQSQQQIKAARESREQIAAKVIDILEKREFDNDEQMPFRQFLLEGLVPYLTDGLVEVSNILPDDPIDFLAEYLYKQSYELGEK